jgi:beta-lactamase regulating signal transducer with metallopeptidase domain/protocatechuate 3,4-dioxygenase beta subunit
MNALLSLLGQATWQSALIVLLVWGICRLFPKLPASVRCWLWRLTLVKFLLALVVPLPALRLPLLPASPPPVTVAVAVRSPEIVPTVAPVRTTTASAAGTMPSEPIRKPAFREPVRPSFVTLAIRPRLATLPSLPALLTGFWMLGVGVGVLRLLVLASRSRRWLRGNSTPVTDPALLATLATLADRLGVRRLPLLLTAPDIALPMVIGLRRPAIVLPLPERLIGFTEEATTLMLAHELAHLRRRDLAWNWLSTVVRIVFFFHPLVYLARREEEMAREMACDSLALEAVGAPVVEYGNLLLKIASLGRAGSGETTPVTVLGVSGAAGALKQRLIALQNRSPLSVRQRRIAAVGLLSLAIVGLIPWRVVAQQRPVVVEKASSNRVQGRVVAPGGKPIAGAKVTQYHWKTRTPEILSTVKTDAEGTFVLPWTGERTDSALLVNGEGYGISVVSLPDRAEKPVKIMLVPAIETDVQFVDSNGRPVPGLTVSTASFDPRRGFAVSLTDLDPKRFPAKTDDSGKIRVNGLAAGRDVYFLTKDDRFPKINRAVITPNTIVLKPASRAAGRVTIDSTGKPGVGYTVMAFLTLPNNGPGIPEAILTDSKGGYRFDRLQPGKYQFRVFVPDHSLIAPVQENISAEVGQLRAGIDFILKPAIVIKGRITDIATGRPVTGIKVSQSKTTDDFMDTGYSTFTDSDGEYYFRVAPGPLTIHLEISPLRNAPGLNAPNGRDSYRKSLIAKAGQEYTQDFRINARFAPTGVSPITGRVLGPDNRAVTGAEVLLLMGQSGITDQDQRRVRTDAQGRFIADALPQKWIGSKVEIRVRRGDLVSRPIQVMVMRSGAKPLTIPLVRGLGASVAGRVTDANGRALSHVPVRLWAWAIASHRQYSEQVVTDTQGRYRFDSLWPDMNYGIESQPAGYVGRSIDIREYNPLKPGEVRSDRNFILEAARKTLTGQLVTPAGRPVVQAILSLSARDGDFHSALPDAQGRFRFTQIGEGPMTLTVQPRWDEGQKSASSAAFRQTVKASESPLRVVVK